jgi:hypothetical protein
VSFMDRDQFIKSLKIILVMALLIGVIGAILFLVYGFTVIWQAMAATVITIFLSIVVILFIILSIYLWIKNLLLKRELKGTKTELNRCKKELKRFRTELEKTPRNP